MSEITLPVLDENVTEYKIAQWLKAVGDPVALHEPLLEVETDKVTMEVVANEAGILTEQSIPVGTVIEVGAILGRMRTGGNGQSAETTPPINSDPDMSRKMTPVVARMVAEHNIEIAEINGSGRGGRVTKRDIAAYILARETQPSVKPIAPRPTPIPKTPATQPSTAGSTMQPLTGMRRNIADHMMRSLQNSAQVTTVFEFDFSTVAEHRSQNKRLFASEGIKLTYMAYIMHATAHALRRFPIVNSSFYDEEGIALKKDVNVGLIVAVDHGLFAPVVHHADRLNLRGLAATIDDVATRGRAGTLTAADMQHGTFTISNHGASGSLIGTPIIYQPQAGILGIGAIEERVKVVNGGIHIRPMAYISFSFDHRIMDGAVADGFVAEIKQQIENWR